MNGSSGPGRADAGPGPGGRSARPAPAGGLYDQPFTSRHIEVTDGGNTVAAAEVTLAGGIAYASLRAAPGHIRPGRRASLVDALMDLPQVRASSRLEATIPLGDVELLQRLRERTQNPVTRPAGSTALLDATIPPGGPGSPAQSQSRGPHHHGRRAGSARPGPNVAQAGKEATAMATTVTQELRDTLLSAIRTSQEITLHAIRAWVETAGYFTPKVSYPHLPLAGRLPKAHDIVARSLFGSRSRDWDAGSPGTRGRRVPAGP